MYRVAVKTIAAVLAVTLASGLTACGPGTPDKPRESCGVPWAEVAPPPPPPGGPAPASQRVSRFQLVVYALLGPDFRTHVCVPFAVAVYGTADGIPATVDDGTGSHTLPWNAARATPWAAAMTLTIDNEERPTPARWNIDLQATWNPPTNYADAPMPTGDIEFGCDIFVNAESRFAYNLGRGNPPNKAILSNGRRAFVRCQISGTT